MCVVDEYAMVNLNEYTPGDARVLIPFEALATFGVVI